MRLIETDFWTLRYWRWTSVLVECMMGKEHLLTASCRQVWHLNTSDVHFKLWVITCVAAIRCGDAVVVQKFSIRGLLVGISGGRTSHPWNFGQTSRGSFGHWRAATLQQELPVVDDPGSTGGRAEQGPSGSSGIVVGHVRRVVDGHPPGRRDGLGSGLLAVSGHPLSTMVN